MQRIFFITLLILASSLIFSPAFGQDQVDGQQKVDSGTTTFQMILCISAFSLSILCFCFGIKDRLVSNPALFKLQDFYDNPKAYKSSDTEESKIKKSGRSNSKPNTSKEESKPSRISEAVIQAEFDKNSTLNSMALGWAIILGSLLIIALNFF